MLQYQKDSPFRVPDWRWHRAADLCRRARATDRRYDDEMICRAKQFITETDACTSEQDRWDLMQRWGSLYEAHFLHTDDLAVRRRHELEARLLTRVGLDRVAKKMGMKLDLIRW